MFQQPAQEEERHLAGEPQLLPEPPSGPDTWGDWRRVLDGASGRCYYHNTSTQVVTWELPAGWGRETQPAHTTSAAPGASGGWFYSDLQGSTQGPFSTEQLAGWRGVLPLELRVWHQAADAAATAAVPLAQVTGDVQLLTLLRSGQLPLPPNATAAHAEAVLAATEAAANAAGGDAWWAAHEAAQSGGAPPGDGVCNSLFSELAEASLAGMPEDVRARVLAGDSGEAAAPSRGGGHEELYSMRSVVNTGTGRVTLKPEVGFEEAIADARGAPREYVTAQLAHHMDVGTLNEWLSQRMEHKKTLPPEVWKVLKQRREEKKRKNSAWLRD